MSWEEKQRRTKADKVINKQRTKEFVNKPKINEQNKEVTKKSNQTRHRSNRWSWPTFPQRSGVVNCIEVHVLHRTGLFHHIIGLDPIGPSRLLAHSTDIKHRTGLSCQGIVLCRFQSSLNHRHHHHHYDHDHHPLNLRQVFFKLLMSLLVFSAIHNMFQLWPTPGCG